MTEHLDGNETQSRVIAKQLFSVWAEENGVAKKPAVEIPAPLKWAAAIIAGVFTMGIGAMALWLVTTVNEMQVTLARMDERMANSSTTQDGRFDEINRRLSRLEALQSGEGR